MENNKKRIKLKTLNDIHTLDIGIRGRMILKKEAIKWIKQLNEETFEIIGGLYSWEINNKRPSTFMERAILIGWIKHFFNLTERGLE